MLAMAIVSIVASVGPADLAERRILFPSLNFGQVILSATAAGVVLDALGAGTPLQMVVAAALAGLVHVTVNAVFIALLHRLLGFDLAATISKGWRSSCRRMS